MMGGNGFDTSSILGSPVMLDGGRTFMPTLICVEDTPALAIVTLPTAANANINFFISMLL
jgi:hypothetical protein